MKHCFRLTMDADFRLALSFVAIVVVADIDIHAVDS
jgi:hypothetical protein